MSHSRSTENGFVLLEAAVAVLIVSFVAVAALSLAGTELRVSERAQRLTDARALATDRIDLARLLPESVLVRLPDSLAEGRFEPPFDDYAWRIEARRLHDPRDLVDLSVVVTWGSGSYGLRTRVFRPDRRSRRSP